MIHSVLKGGKKDWLIVQRQHSTRYWCREATTTTTLHTHVNQCSAIRSTGEFVLHPVTGRSRAALSQLLHLSAAAQQLLLACSAAKDPHPPPHLPPFLQRGETKPGLLIAQGTWEKNIYLELEQEGDTPLSPQTNPSNNWKGIFLAVSERAFQWVHSLLTQKLVYVTDVSRVKRMYLKPFLTLRWLLLTEECG